MSRHVAVVAGMIAALCGRDVWALCPNCLGQSPTVSSTLAVVGVFLLVPPAVFFAVALAVRRLGAHRG